MSVEYKIVPTSQKISGTETVLNEFALKGWRVVGFTEHMVLIERDQKGQLNEDSIEATI